MIPSDLYESYETALEENDREALAALAAIMAQLDRDDNDAVRDALLIAFPALVALFGQRAAQVALEFYEGVREDEGVQEEFHATLAPITDDDRAVYASDVRRLMGGLYSGSSTFEAFESSMQGMATKRTMQMADSTLYALANADPAHPKVALVPHAGACGWCVLIGSRGFTNTEQAMEHMRHDGCKCTTVVDFDRDNPALEGYDSRELYDIYSDVSTYENQDKWREEWLAMSDEERARYVKRKRDKTGAVKEVEGDWSTYVRNRTVQEMNVKLRSTKATRIQ
jgi:hypothetical protein